MPPLQILPNGQSNTPAADPEAIVPGSGAPSPGTAGSVLAPTDPASATDPGGVLSPVAPGSASSPGAVTPANPSPANTVPDPVRYDVEQDLSPEQQAQARENIGARKGGEWLYIIIAGQSNALNRAIEAGTLSKDPDENIQIWNHAATEWQTWDLATNTTQILGPLNGGAGPSNGAYNFAWCAAKELVAKNGLRVRVFVEAEGGDSIDNFVPSTANHWARLQAQIAAAAPPALDAFLWHQGETDRVKTHDSYEGLLDDLRSQARSLTGWSDKGMILFGELLERGRADASTVPFSGHQNEAIRRFGNERYPDTRVVPLGNLSGRAVGDEVHFNAKSSIIAGKMYADSISANLFRRKQSALDGWPVSLDLDSRFGKEEDAAVSNRLNYWHDRRTGNYTSKKSTAANYPLIEIFGGYKAINTNISTMEMYIAAIPQPFTLIGVVTIPAVNLTVNNHVLFDAYGAAGASRCQLFSNGQSGNGGVLKLNCGTTLASANPPAVDTPVFIAGVANGANSKIYEADVEVASGDAGSNAFGDNGRIYIGNTDSGSSGSTMRLHRLMIVPKALSATQIADFHRALRLEHGF